MAAICYVCNKRSTKWCQNFAELKSQHTQTPIANFIRQFFGDFHPTRDIDDKHNYICTECLEQIDDYDWLRQQVAKQERKLCSLLLATEVKLSGEYDDENDDGRHKHAFMDILDTTEIKLESDSETGSTDAREEQPPIPTPPPKYPTLSPEYNETSKLVPTNQLKRRRLCSVTTRPKDAASQKNNGILASTATAINSKVITSSMDTLSFTQHNAPAKATDKPEKQLPPNSTRTSNEHVH